MGAAFNQKMKSNDHFKALFGKIQAYFERSAEERDLDQYRSN